MRVSVTYKSNGCMTYSEDIGYQHGEAKCRVHRGRAYLTIQDKATSVSKNKQAVGSFSGMDIIMVNQLICELTKAKGLLEHQRHLDIITEIKSNAR